MGFGYLRKRPKNLKDGGIDNYVSYLAPTGEPLWFKVPKDMYIPEAYVLVSEDKFALIRSDYLLVSAWLDRVRLMFRIPNVPSTLVHSCRIRDIPMRGAVDHAFSCNFPSRDAEVDAWIQRRASRTPVVRELDAASPVPPPCAQPRPALRGANVSSSIESVSSVSRIGVGVVTNNKRKIDAREVESSDEEDPICEQEPTPKDRKPSEKRPRIQSPIRSDKDYDMQVDRDEPEDDGDMSDSQQFDERKMWKKAAQAERQFNDWKRSKRAGSHDSETAEEELQRLVEEYEVEKLEERARKTERLSKAKPLEREATPYSTETGEDRERNQPVGKAMKSSCSKPNEVEVAPLHQSTTKLKPANEDEAVGVRRKSAVIPKPTNMPRPMARDEEAILPRQPTNVLNPKPCAGDQEGNTSRKLSIQPMSIEEDEETATRRSMTKPKPKARARDGGNLPPKSTSMPKRVNNYVEEEEDEDAPRPRRPLNTPELLDNNEDEDVGQPRKGGKPTYHEEDDDDIARPRKHQIKSKVTEDGDDEDIPSPRRRGKAISAQGDEDSSEEEVPDQDEDDSDEDVDERSKVIKRKGKEREEVQPVASGSRAEEIWTAENVDLLEQTGQLLHDLIDRTGLPLHTILKKLDLALTMSRQDNCYSLFKTYLKVTNDAPGMWLSDSTSL